MRGAEAEARRVPAPPAGLFASSPALAAGARTRSRIRLSPGALGTASDRFCRCPRASVTPSPALFPEQVAQATREFGQHGLSDRRVHVRDHPRGLPRPVLGQGALSGIEDPDGTDAGC